ncbi:hypothetical protein [Alicyclobacillus herbarius]|uniref:hypothetical protein n=1 Tax=Alicyclobacillus herbarius TaxID=122960 RepID=UPI00040D71D0|nr:hypothetical protein [Alicyclobacillus herbarius]
MSGELELKILESLLSLFTVLIGAGISALAPRLKRIVSAHASGKEAQLASQVIDGLSAIAEAVVQEFNQKVVSDAKKAGVFTPSLAQSVKQDAVSAVLSQAGPLLSLGEQVIGDIPGLVSSLIEQAVAKHHRDTAKGSDGSTAVDKSSVTTDNGTREDGTREGGQTGSNHGQTCSTSVRPNLPTGTSTVPDRVRTDTSTPASESASEQNLIPPSGN